MKLIHFCFPKPLAELSLQEGNKITEKHCLNVESSGQGNYSVENKAIVLFYLHMFSIRTLSLR